MVLGRFTSILGAGIRAVRLYDEQNNRVNVDRFSESLGVIDVLHHRTHQGVVYTATHLFTSVADDASVDILVQVPAGQVAHLRALMSAGGDAELSVFENPTFSAAGSDLTPRNRNRISGDNSQMTVTFSPTVSDPGTELSTLFAPGGTGFLTPGGGVGSLFEEFVFKTSEDYLVRGTNRAGVAQTLAMELTWYEPDGNNSS